MEVKKQETKVIQISSTSPSFFLNSGKGSIEDLQLDEWAGQVSTQLKKYYPQIEIECWTPEKTFRKEKVTEYKGVKFRAFPSRKIYALRPGMEICPAIISALKKEIKKSANKRLILHLHEYHSWLTYFILFFIKKQKNIKIVAQHHGGRAPLKNLLKYKRLILFFPIIALMQFFENSLFKKINTFYAFGDIEEEYLKKVSPNSEVKFQTMGIDEEFFKQFDMIESRKKLGLNLEKKYIVYLGRIKSTKGIKELLDAIREIPEVNLIMIGKGEDYEKYREYVEEKNIKNVNFVGPIYSKSRLDYLASADCFVLPSYTEGAPVVLMESIATNLPVIATDVGGVKKMVKSGQEGIIIKPRSKEEIISAIRSILKWPKKDIRKSAKKYRWEEIVKKTVEDYEKLFLC